VGHNHYNNASASPKSLGQIDQTKSIKSTLNPKNKPLQPMKRQDNDNFMQNQKAQAATEDLHT